MLSICEKHLWLVNSHLCLDFQPCKLSLQKCIFKHEVAFVLIRVTFIACYQIPVQKTPLMDLEMSEWCHKIGGRLCHRNIVVCQHLRFTTDPPSMLFYIIKINALILQKTLILLFPNIFPTPLTTTWNIFDFLTPEGGTDCRVENVENAASKILESVFVEHHEWGCFRWSRVN